MLTYDEESESFKSRIHGLVLRTQDEKSAYIDGLLFWIKLMRGDPSDLERGERADWLLSIADTCVVANSHE